MEKTNILYWERLVALHRPSYDYFFEKEKEFLSAYLPINSKVLDVCCGTGRTLETLLPLTNNLVGIDNDPDAIKLTNRRLTNSSHVKTILGDALNMPFEKDYFDYSTCFLSIVNFRDSKVDLLKEMARVSKEKILFSVYNEDALMERLVAYTAINTPIDKVNINGKCYLHWDSGQGISEQFSRPDLEKLAKQAGLKVDEIKKEGIGYFCAFSK
jgi:ubiquinone/menaquinone biosynthesis C-methylase UbiE